MSFPRPALPFRLPRLALLLAVAALAGCGYQVNVGGPGPRIEGSGVSVTVTRAIPAFSQIQFDGSARLDLSVGPVQSVTLTFDDNLLPLIDTTVTDGTLHILATKSYHTSSPLRIKIVTPTLTGLTVDGAASLTAAGLDAPAFFLHLSGAGNATLSGQAAQFDLAISGTGTIHAQNLIAQNVTINISGAGDAQVFASQSLDATISGAGSIRYGGSPPRVHKSVSGAGSIKPL